MIYIDDCTLYRTREGGGGHFIFPTVQNLPLYLQGAQIMLDASLTFLFICFRPVDNRELAFQAQSALEHPGFEKKNENQKYSHPPARAIHFQTASPKIEMS
jgi:hypothetical protein